LNTEGIIKIAFELGNAIAQSNEMINLKNQQADLMSKKEAYELIMRYQEAKTRMQHKMMDGIAVTQQEENHLDIMEQQISANPDIQNLLAAQEQLENLMQAVYFAINQGASGDCSSDCSSCGGGCHM
jgi:cell fate (sporulation/competence/biofilm development) regulator YlbF (YheA/YmcA/DUF963 family)